jgi:cellulose synthase/poly-beta-1,6-N-acetylglucosamine synthase-like glycosyltransferase
MLILILILSVFSFVYLMSVLFLYRGLHSLSGGGSQNGLKYSIVIAARNEEQNISKCLDCVLNQSIGLDRYEIIIIDDRSTDSTPQIIAKYSSNYPNVKGLTVKQTPPGVSPKKHAVLQGIKSSVNEIVVFTDADCLVPDRWLETIDRYFTEDTGLVQGITTYFYPDGMNRLFYGLQAIDFLSHGIVAASGIGAHMPINSNANNFAFRKSVFDSVEGYGSAQKIISGDDDLLLQRIWKSGKWKIKFMTDESGAVLTAPTPTIKGVFEQRKRWGSKTVHYNVGQVLFLGNIFLFYLSIIVSFVAGLFIAPLLIASMFMLIVKLAGESMLMFPGSRIFKQESLRKYIIPASLIQTPLVIAAVLAGTAGKFNWKGQEFKREVSSAGPKIS